MTFYFRNNDIDFTYWCHHLAPAALAYLKHIKPKDVGLLFDRTYYDNCLRIKQQLFAIESLLNDEHLMFFQEILLKNAKYGRNPQTAKLREEIYKIWSTVCFPKGKSPIKTIDPVLLGGELRLIRINKHLGIQKVAGITGVSADSIYAYEEGIRMIRADSLYKLTQVYEADIAKLLEKAEANEKILA